MILKIIENQNEPLKAKTTYFDNIEYCNHSRKKEDVSTLYNKNENVYKDIDESNNVTVPVDIFIRKSKEQHGMVVITNKPTYLMSDNGKTLECII